MSVNGRNYDWEDMHIVLPSGEAVGITEIKYTDGQSIEARYGRGGRAARLGPGQLRGFRQHDA